MAAFLLVLLSAFLCKYTSAARQRSRGPQMHPEDWLYYNSHPTPEPTSRPTPNPLHKYYSLQQQDPMAMRLFTAHPTTKPTIQPTPEPTPKPTPSPIEIVDKSPINTFKPTPSITPTHKHIPQSPTKHSHFTDLDYIALNVMKSSTPTPILWSYDKEMCGGDEFDVVIFLDNSCGLSEADCADLLEGVGDIIGDILNYPIIRVSTFQFGATRKNIEMLVDFYDDELQKNYEKYERYIRKHGQCTNGGEGETNLYAAIKKSVANVK